jgi:glycosyltransferase involved in cell wall biosynthesis
VQNIYVASLNLRLPQSVSAELAYLSKLWLDRKSQKPAGNSDIFLFYSGAGLGTARRLRQGPVIRIVEAVNSHVLVQERILREEHKNLGLPFAGFHRREMARRVAEYREADAILCPSSFVRRSFIEEGFPEDRILLVPYGFTPPEIPISGEKNGDSFRVLYVGQISIRKGLRYLLQAFAKLKHPRKELWIVGPRTQLTGIDDLEIPDGTSFPGPLKGADLSRAYQQASVFVLPTLEDGFGLVLGEALSFGRPVITTVNSGGAELIQEGIEGFSVPIRDTASILEKLQLLAGNPGLLERMSSAALVRGRLIGGWSTAEKLLLDGLSKISKHSST